MTWLLNQFQKVISTFKKGAQQEKDSNPSAIANRLASDLSSQRRPNTHEPDIDEVEPVALRESSVAPAKIPDPFEPAIHNNVAQNAVVQTPQPEYISNDSSISAEAITDTHQRIDAAPAALPGETITAPSFPTAVSDLISATADAPIELKPSRQDEQPPAIHDLLPAIEPDEPEPEIAAIEAVEESKDLLEENAQAEQAFAISEQVEENQLSDNMPAVESAQRVSGEDVTLFSFNITESEAPDVDEIAIEEKGEDLVEVEPASGPGESTESDTSNTLLSYEPAVIEQPANLQQPENPASVEAKDSRSNEPINPWLSAVPTKSTAAVAASDISEPTNQTQEQEQEQKVGTVKLLFKLKQGNFHGYISPYDGSKDILFHQKYINAEIFDQIERGSEVTADIKYIEGKVYATHVALT